MWSECHKAEAKIGEFLRTSEEEEERAWLRTRTVTIHAHWDTAWPGHRERLLYFTCGIILKVFDKENKVCYQPVLLQLKSLNALN